MNISFPEHNSATHRNILMVLGRVIEQVNADCRCKNENSANLGFLITSPYPFLYLVSGLSLSDHLKYVMILCRIVELVNAECRI